MKGAGNERNSRRILLGRDAEVAEITTALDELRHGRGALYFIAGEPGIGKTRLCDEIARVATTREVAVHWGRAWEVGGAPAYWPFIQVLRSVCRESGIVEPLPDAVRSELVELLPELGQSSARVHERVQERFQLFDAVSRLFALVTERAPQLVVLDDLHAADTPSLLLLQFLARDLRSRPLLLLGTYRDAEARLSTETAALFARIARDATLLPLRRLERAEVAEYVARASGATPNEENVESLYRQTEGNPLFLRELLQLRDSLARRPEGIREVVRARLGLLEPRVKSTLEIASVLGREIDPLLVARIGGLSEVDVQSDIKSAIDAAIVEPVEGERYRFTHVLLREGLYTSLTPERCATLHRLAAKAMDSSAVAEIAHHLLEAIPLEASVAEAVDAAMRAAERAMGVLAFEEARDLLARAAKLLEGGDDEARFIEVLLALGQARVRAGEFKEGSAICLRAAKLARERKDGALFARAVLGSAYEFTPGIPNVELVALLEEALAILPEGDGALRARCMAQLAAERQIQPDMRPNVELARAAIAMARRLDDRETLRFTLSVAGLAMMFHADPEERIAIDFEALRLALAVNDKRVALRSYLLLSNDHWEKGDPIGSDAHAKAYGALVAEFQHGAFDWTGVGMRAARLLWRGEFDEAERAYEQALTMMRKDNARGASMAMTPVGVACARERYDDVAGIEARVRHAFGATGYELNHLLGEMVITELHGRAGDRVRAAAQLAVVRAHPLFSQVEEATFLALLADACHLVADVDLAQRIYTTLLPRADRFLTLSYLGPCAEPPCTRQLGLLAQTLGRLDEAIRHFENALERTTNAGMRAYLARLRFELARALCLRGGASDSERAEALLDEARALAMELGQSGLLAQMGSGAANEQPPKTTTPSASREPQHAFTIAREGEIWTITQGKKAVRLKDSRGLRVLDQLVASPGQEFHVLQLVAGASAEGDIDRGDAGVVLDQEAIASYRRRLLDLREELEEAEGFGDRGRADRAKTEIDFLTAELTRAVGLGGRERRAGGAAERARTTVQKRLREAIRRIGDELPEVGAHLDVAIRTGTFCGYFPDGRPR